MFKLVQEATLEILLDPYVHRRLIDIFTVDLPIFSLNLNWVILGMEIQLNLWSFLEQMGPHLIPLAT